MRAIIVFCTFPDETLACRIAEEVIAAGLAACCQVGTPVRSVYRWQGKVEHAVEVPLTCKTMESSWPELEALLKARHPYAVPEIIAVPVTHGLPAYLDWVRANSQIAAGG